MRSIGVSIKAEFRVTAKHKNQTKPNQSSDFYNELLVERRRSSSSSRSSRKGN